MGIVRSCLAALFETQAALEAKAKQAQDKVELLAKTARATSTHLRRKIAANRDEIKQIRATYQGIPKSGPVADRVKALTKEMNQLQAKYKQEKAKLEFFTTTETRVQKLQDAKKTQDGMEQLATTLQELGWTDQGLQLTDTTAYANVIGQVNTNIKKQIENVDRGFEVVDDLEHMDSDEDELEEKMAELDAQLELEEQADMLRIKMNVAPPSDQSVAVDNAGTESDWERSIMK